MVVGDILDIAALVSHSVPQPAVPWLGHKPPACQLAGSTGNMGNLSNSCEISTEKSVQAFFAIQFVESSMKDFATVVLSLKYLITPSFVG